MIEEMVPEALAGERIDRVVAMITGCSRAEAARLVAEGSVLIDDDPVTVRSHRVEPGQVLRFPEPPTGPDELTPDREVEIDVVFADDDVVVVDKAPGLVVHPGAGHVDGTLVQGLLARFPEMAAVGEADRPGIVHRLDRGTSGLLVAARSRHAYDDLVTQLSGRTVDREYTALVWGHPADPTGMIDAPVGRSARRPTRMTVSESGREARTRYEVVATYSDPAVVARLLCRLETGRTHQIRVHLAAIGHPIVGDDAYGGDRPGIDADRPLLHAGLLGFTHPVSGDRLRFESPIPPDFEAVLSTLRT